MTESATTRRRELCDLLSSLTLEQWTAETLCAGWDAADITAHLIVREREPWTGPGLVLGGPFADLTDRRRAAWKARGREALIGALRAGPPWPLTVAPLEGTQVVEDWIHEQDVRRGGAGLSTPPPRPGLERLLWGAARRFALRTLSVDANVVIELTDGRRRRRLQSRRRLPFATSTDAAADVTITGRVAELLLYAVGRDGAEVEVTGDAAAGSLLAASPRSV
ncbi:MAG TPA: maleylpyruvate isomerase family mycothiol-dependent enzyme [Euzebyales bacterium]|nr:maleylpyruvate isomerase family mycothiol-dependent enzyme [Euzebyales bacterium]